MSYTIRIGSSGDTSGIDKVTGALGRADDAADEFIASIKAGVGIDIGGKLVNSLAAIPGVIEQAISRGMEFNMQMNDSEIGIANVLAKFQGLNKEAAKGEAAKAMAKIVELEPKTAAGLQDLVQGFMATVASAQSAGVSVEQNIDLVGKFANALANANIDASQLSQELRAIFTGNITPDASLAKILSIESADVEKAKEAGKLYEFLTEKVGSIGDAGDSAGVRLSTLNSQIDKTLGEITRPIFDVWVQGLTDLTEAAGSDTEAIKQLGVEISKLVKTGMSLTSWLTQHSGLVAAAAKVVGLLAAAWAAYKITSIVAGIAGKTRAIMASTAALTAETAALRANSAAQASNVGRGVVPGRGMIGGGMGVALAGEAAVSASVMLYNSIGDLAAGMSQGGKSSTGDIASAQELRNKNMERFTQLLESVKGVKSTADRDAVFQSLLDESKNAQAGVKDAGFFEEGRTAQNQALVDHAASISQIIQVLKSKDAGLLSPEQAAAKLDEEQKKAREKQRSEENAPVMEADRDRRSEKDRSGFSSFQIEQAKEAADKGQYDYANAIIDSAEKYQRDQLSAVNPNPETMDKDQLKEALDLRTELESYLENIKAARKDLTETIAENEKKATEEATKKKIEALQEEAALIEAQGKKRLADVEALNLKERETLERRKQIEDEIAAKKLGIENQIGSLSGESATVRETRQIAAAASQTMRDAEFQTAKTGADTLTKGGELFGGTRRRRGVLESDAMASNALNLAPGASLLDQFKSSQGVAVGAVNGKSILAPDPTSSLSPSSSRGGKTSVADAGKEAGEGAKDAGQEAASAVRELGSTITSSLQGITKEIAAVKSQVSAMANKT